MRCPRRALLLVDSPSPVGVLLLVDSPLLAGALSLVDSPFPVGVLPLVDSPSPVGVLLLVGSLFPARAPSLVGLVPRGVRCLRSVCCLTPVWVSAHLREGPGASCGGVPARAVAVGSRCGPSRRVEVVAELR
ncbi:hypothetical protein [Streptomyces sp. 3330]|uniref:hypothetical protein n=1 Tax=Streptomyces sp. 3330 TaxID=2817755 RepID=UPI00286A8E20|nr:hypothetical protein [Streptomyces sp. 3330]